MNDFDAADLADHLDDLGQEHAEPRCALCGHGDQAIGDLCPACADWVEAGGRPASRCAVPGCQRAHYGRGLCSMHYQRQRKHGDPLTRSQRHTAFRWLITMIADTGSSDDCISWPFARSNGYGILRVRGRNFGAHNLVCTLVTGPAPEGHEAAHYCGRADCVNPHHIRWATRHENQADRLVHGTHNRGERCAQAKLTDEDVRSIRTLIGKIRQRDIADIFGVSAVTVSNISTGKSWWWLDQGAGT